MTATPSVAMDFQLKDTSTVLTHALVARAASAADIDVSTLAAANAALAMLDSPSSPPSSVRTVRWWPTAR